VCFVYAIGRDGVIDLCCGMCVDVWEEGNICTWDVHLLLGVRPELSGVDHKVCSKIVH
jgi:hypothetical protein